MGGFMTNLQKIKAVAKTHDLTFKPKKATINGARLYAFINDSGNIVADNWTISSAIDEINFGDLGSKLL